MGIPAVLEGKLRLPLIGAPMFIVSRPALVIAQCTSGIVGSFPALNARPQQTLADWIVQIKDALGQYQEEHPSHPVAPFAVNQIVHKSNERLYADMETCVRHEVPIVITSLRPPEDVVNAVHEYGGLVFHDVISLRHAQKAMDQGVDGTLILSGCMSNGGDILAALAMGADLAYMGTRFIATEEAHAAPDYKKMIVDSKSADIVYSSLFSGIHGNYLKGSVANAGYDPDDLPTGDSSSMDFSKQEQNEAKAWRDIWSAGQGTGGVDEILPAAELVVRIEKEYDAARLQFGTG